jgi:hypothetical protein
MPLKVETPLSEYDLLQSHEIYSHIDIDPSINQLTLSQLP